MSMGKSGPANSGQQQFDSASFAPGQSVPGTFSNFGSPGMGGQPLPAGVNLSGLGSSIASSPVTQQPTAQTNFFQPLPGNPQQIQNIAQGQPTLVNQLAPPPPSGPAPGTTITQQPAPFPQAQPQFATPPRVNMDFLGTPGFSQQPPAPAFSPPPRVNMDFLRTPPPPPPVLNMRTPTPEQANINSLNQVLNILQRNPTFAPGAAGQFTPSQLPTRAPQTMRPQALTMPIRQPAAGQVLRRPTAVPYRLPTTTRPRSR